MTDKEFKLDINGVTYREDVIESMSSDKRLFDGAPSVGNCFCGELDVTIMIPSSQIPKNAELVPYTRKPGGTWKKKSVYFIYNRKEDELTGNIKITAYDAIYRSEAPYLSAGDQGYWPRLDIDVMDEIAERTGTVISSGTRTMMNKQYEVPYPGVTLEGDQGQTILEPDLDGALTMREVASRIAMFYGGSWIIDNNGEWRLIRLGDIPPETNYLITEDGEPITLGGDRILIIDGLVEPHRLVIQNGDTLTLGGVRLLV